MADNKVVLELGYSLIRLVNNTNSRLIIAISTLRKQKPCLPLIRIKDNMALAPLEFSINNERHLLDSKSDNFVAQIVLFITQYVEEHPEIKNK